MANLSTAVVQSMRPRFALKWIFLAVLIILGFVGLNYASKQLNWEPIIYARIVGGCAGVLAGLIVLVSVPARWQALLAGSALGISIDEISNGTPSGSTIGLARYGWRGRRNAIGWWRGRTRSCPPRSELRSEDASRRVVARPSLRSFSSSAAHMPAACRRPRSSISNNPE